MENDSIEKYNKLLHVWAYDENKIDDVHANFPDYYGGAYINDDRKLVIQVTEPNDTIKNELSDMISLDNVVAVYVNSTGKGRIYYETVNDCKKVTDFSGIKIVYGCGESEPAEMLYPGGQITNSGKNRSGGIVAGGGNATIRNVAGIVTVQHQNKLIYVKVMELKSRLNITVY